MSCSRSQELLLDLLPGPFVAFCETGWRGSAVPAPAVQLSYPQEKREFMNGSTEVRTGSTSPQTPNAPKTDTPLPLERPVSEVGSRSAVVQPSRGHKGERLISGIDLI